jgi:hypothetical protein
MPRVRHFAFSVSTRDAKGQSEEETFPVRASDYATASRLAFVYVLEVLKYKDFELRIVGS